MDTERTVAPSDLKGFQSQFLRWYVGLQPAERTNGLLDFNKMKPATEVKPEGYIGIRSISRDGLVLILHGLSWLLCAPLGKKSCSVTLKVVKDFTHVLQRAALQYVSFFPVCFML